MATSAADQIVVIVPAKSGVMTVVPGLVLNNGASVRAYDPVGMEQAKGYINNVTFCDDAYACAKGASALVIVTEWEQFRALDFGRLKDVMVNPLLVDLRNIYRADEVARHGFAYESVGRGTK